MKRKSLPTGRDFLFVEGYGNENPGAFQSTRPLRGATAHPYIRGLIPAFQPTRPLRGATFCPCCPPYTRMHFNPRAPCGARQFRTVKYESGYGISTHAPLAGRDHGQRHGVQHPQGFQPTRPLRGATSASIIASCGNWNFNPRAPCGARRTKQKVICSPVDISTHAPLAGRDSLSDGEAASVPISTHAPLAGRDCVCTS